MTWPVVVLALGLLAGLVAFARFRRGWLDRIGALRSQLQRESDALALARTGLSADSWARLDAAGKLDERMRTIEIQATELSQLRGTTQESARKCDEYLDMIQVAQKERDGWKTMYYRESAEHGNAQALLFREIGRCAAAARAAGKALKVNAVVEQALREHRETHAEPAWQVIGQKPAPLEVAPATGA